MFKYYTERTTGSHIEVKKGSITRHYRSSDPEWGTCGMDTGPLTRANWGYFADNSSAGNAGICLRTTSLTNSQLKVLFHLNYAKLYGC